MAQSGIRTTEQAQTIFSQMKAGKDPHKESRILYLGIVDGEGQKQVVDVVHVRKYFDGENNQDRFDNFAKQLCEEYKEKPLFVVYDVPFISKAGADTKKLMLISWCPDCCKIKERMVFSSTKNSLVKSLDVAKEVQCNDGADLNYEEFVSKLR